MSTLKDRKMLKPVQHDGKSYAYSENKNNAFTLAEVLIVLVVIGVISATVIPTLKQNLDAKVNSSRQANIAYKVTQAMDTMKSLGLLENTYASTDDFVDVLQKYLKINKRCKANEIADCWGTDTVIASNDKEYEVKDAKKGENLGLDENTTDNVGLILADGASIILTYNENATPISATAATEPSAKSLPVGFGKYEWFNYYTTNSTAPIDFVMDVNGGRKPNTEATGSNSNYDIRPFRTAHFAVSAPTCEALGGHEITSGSQSGKCLINLGTSYNPISESPYTSNNNYWAGARDACAALNRGTGFHLTTPRELGSNGYDSSPGYGDYGKLFGTNGLFNYSAADKARFGIPIGTNVWSSMEKNSNAAYFVNYNSGGSHADHNKDSKFDALCLGTL